MRVSVPVAVAALLLLTGHCAAADNLDDAIGFIESLGQIEASAESACSIDPQLPAWDASIGSLRQKTQIALEQAFYRGQTKFNLAHSTTDTAYPVDTGLCISAMQRATKIIEEMPRFFTGLHRLGH